MNILIVGGGLVGSTLAEKLASDGHDVTVVESDPSRVLDLRDTLDCQLIEGNGALPSVLSRAGVEKADLLLATTNADAFNLIVGKLGTAVFNTPRVGVRVREEEHAKSFARMSESVPGEHFCVNPAAAATERILSLLDVPGALDVVSFMDGRLLVAGFRILPASDFAGLLLSHIKLMFPDTPTIVTAIRRRDEWIVPSGEEEIQVNDIVYFSIARQELDSVLLLVGALEEGNLFGRLGIEGAAGDQARGEEGGGDPPGRRHGRQKLAARVFETRIRKAMSAPPDDEARRILFGQPPRGA